jgi:hypothetical protein
VDFVVYDRLDIVGTIVPMMNASPLIYGIEVVLKGTESRCSEMRVAAVETRQRRRVGKSELS